MKTVFAALILALFPWVISAIDGSMRVSTEALLLTPLKLGGQNALPAELVDRVLGKFPSVRKAQLMANGGDFAIVGLDIELPHDGRDIQVALSSPDGNFALPDLSGALLRPFAISSGMDSLTLAGSLRRHGDGRYGIVRTLSTHALVAFSKDEDVNPMDESALLDSAAKMVKAGGLEISPELLKNGRFGLAFISWELPFNAKISKGETFDGYLNYLIGTKKIRLDHSASLLPSLVYDDYGRVCAVSAQCDIPPVDYRPGLRESSLDARKVKLTALTDIPIDIKAEASQK